jgi:hypothetical protein
MSTQAVTENAAQQAAEQLDVRVRQITAVARRRLCPG